MSSTSQIRVVKHSKAYWNATFDNPPINLFDFDTTSELQSLITQLETDKEVAVIVFDSADPDFFISHYDLTVDMNVMQNQTPGPSGMLPYLDVLTRLSRLPLITIVSLRGRVRGAGNEFIQSCDMRFASRENAIIGQFEVGMGVVPGGNVMARLSQSIGRGRALEVLAGADDFSGELAERYGLVNRALPDSELDAFVDAFAVRVASFDKVAIAGVKSFVDRYTLPDDCEFPPAAKAFFETAAKTQRPGPLFAHGLQTRSKVELNLGHYLEQEHLKEL